MLYYKRKYFMKKIEKNCPWKLDLDPFMLAKN